MLLGEETIEFYAPSPSAVAKAEKGEEFTLWDSDGLNFGDLLDVVNPLQHIPVVSTVYRDLTGDDIGHGPRILGGALFGGAIGAAASLANVLIDEATGDDIGGHVMAFLFDEGTGAGEPGGATEVAATSHGSSPVEAKPWVNPDTRPRVEPLAAAVQQVIASAEPAETAASPVAPANPRLPGETAHVGQPPAAAPPVAAVVQPTDRRVPTGSEQTDPFHRTAPEVATPSIAKRSAPAVPPSSPRQLAPEGTPSAVADPTVPAEVTPAPAAKRSPGALAAAPGRSTVPPYGVKPDTQVPFLHDSMLSALEKYERLVRERKAGPGQVDLSG